MRDNCKCIIGNGVVVDPQILSDEIDELKKNGFIKNENQLLVGAMSHLVMPYHRLIDRLREESLGKESIGTTGRGIGPAYEDKITRRGLRVGELLNLAEFESHLKKILPVKNQEILNYSGTPMRLEVIMEEVSAWKNNLEKYIGDSVSNVHELMLNNNVLLEGAQGTLLDIDFGTYPFVTSSSTSAGGACAGSGVGPRNIENVVGIVKAYTTRVGNGPFPTELFDDDGLRLQNNGCEIGATTGRKRRCGWLDLATTKRIVEINSVNKVVLTKLDILSGMKTIKVCVGYEINDKTYEYIPTGFEKEAKPIYESMDGWDQDVSQIRSYSELPDNARKYIEYIENFIGAQVMYVSVGKERDACIKVNNK